MSHAKTFLIVSVLASVACGGASRDEAVTASPQRNAISVRDSIRARRNAQLAVRPDTLGMRADSSRIVGATSATLWVVITSDFQCPACRAFALEVLPRFRREFVDSGKVRLAFVNDPQDKYFNSRFASHAALCAGTAGKFWEMHDSLFATLPTWDRMPDPRPYMDSLAVAAGVPRDVQGKCTQGNRMLRLLHEDIERSASAGVSRLPSVTVGDRRLTSEELTVAGLRRAVRQALGAR